MWRSGAEVLVTYFAERGEMLVKSVSGSSRAPVVARWLDAQESAIQAALGLRADELPLPRRVAAAIEEARKEERAVVRTAAGERVAELQGTHAAELATATKRIRDLEVALATATDRIRDLEAVAAGADAESLAERARRNPSDWLLGLSAALSRVAAQPQLNALAAGREALK